MTESPDDQLFAWIKTRLDALTAITNITGGDGIVRDDWSETNKPGYPRVEYNPYRYSVSEGGWLYSGQFGITVMSDRTAGTTYGSGSDRTIEGDLWTMEASVIASLSNAIPSLTGFNTGLIEWTARRRPTQTPDDFVGRRLNFGLKITTDGLVPLSGGDATLTGLPAGLVVSWWNISVVGGLRNVFTGEDDDAQQIDVDRPIARVNIGVRVADNDGAAPITMYPAVGSSTALTFGIASGVTFTDTVKFSQVQFTTRRADASSPITAVIRGTISSAASVVFSGVAV